MEIIKDIVVFIGFGLWFLAGYKIGKSETNWQRKLP